MTSARRCLLGPSLAAALLVPAVAHATTPTERFSATQPGKIIAIGNSLGLSHLASMNAPGTADSIGTFISLGTGSDTSPAPGGWPMGTTNDWTKNGSTAVLTIPQETQILYAELVWGGSWNYGGEVTTASTLDTPVTLHVDAATSSIMPDPATALTIATTGHNTNGSTFAANYYMRSADVTQLVQQHGGGTIAVSGVPATQTETINSLNAAGWSLIIALRDPQEPIRNLAVYVGGTFVDENTTVDYMINGLCVPPSGPLSGHVAISAIEGDANLTGDQLLIGETQSGTFVNLSGPNNPEDNFFCSQINGEDGTVDTSGSFGSANQNASAGTNVSGGRQSWDVTTVQLTSQAGQLHPNQTSAVLRTITTGDSYVPTVAAFAIDVNAPDLGASSSSMSTLDRAHPGDTFDVTLELDNAGLVSADDLVLKLTLDPALTLTGFTSDGHTGDIDSNPVNEATLTAGVNEGRILPGGTRTVVISVLVNGAPQGPDFTFTPEWDYTFQLCTGSNMPESFEQLVQVPFVQTTSGAGGGSGTSTSTSTSTSSNAGGATGTSTSTSTSTSSNAGGASGTSTSTSTSTSSNAGGGSGTSTSTSTSSNAGGGSGTGTSTSTSSNAGGSTGANSTGGKGVDEGDGFADDAGGCGCAVPGETSAPTGYGLAGLALALSALLRRRPKK